MKQRRSINPLKSILVAAGALAFSAQLFAQNIPETITVTSSAFDHHGTIPLEYTAYGDNKSIDLSWSNLPAGTVQLALICDDPVVPMPQPFVHWVAYNIPATAPGLPAGLMKDVQVTGVAGLEGMINGPQWNASGWIFRCPTSSGWQITRLPFSRVRN